MTVNENAGVAEIEQAWKAVTQAGTELEQAWKAVTQAGTELEQAKANYGRAMTEFERVVMAENERRLARLNAELEGLKVENAQLKAEIDCLKGTT